ncbi:hypothetical protein [Rhizobium leguminosarum]|uniref:hypothetical protein n=1 Tax=Rhizobium leguminosarum TaxID=384 RepID=UPI003F9D2B20
MTLVYDRRVELQGQPLVHAFIVGVSKYTYLPADDQPARNESFNLRQLASCALSAWEICLWLVKNADALACRLGTVRVLLSSSPLEALQPIPGELAGPAWQIQGPQDIGPANWHDFVASAYEWRSDAAAANRAGQTFFYYAGHGLKQSNKDLITLADFADPLGGKLQRSCELIANFVQGMAPTQNRNEIARSQFYFVDCCRENITDPNLAGSYPGVVWDTLGDIDDRGTPVFMGSYPGGRAQAIKGQMTDFCCGLLKAFETASDGQDPDPRKGWPVTSFGLNMALERYFNELKTGQYAPCTGISFKNITLRRLPGPPPIEFSLIISPDAAVKITTVSLQHIKETTDIKLAFPATRYPYKVRSKAGIHKIMATPADKFAPYNDFVAISPFWAELPIDLVPTTNDPSV